MTAMGHEDAFPRPTLSARCRFSQETFARTGRNGRDAPEPVIREFLPVPVGISTMRIGSGRSGLLGRDKPRPGRQSVLVQVHFSLGSIDVS
jgi:hypothetical protein